MTTGYHFKGEKRWRKDLPKRMVRELQAEANVRADNERIEKERAAKTVKEPENASN